MKAQQSEAAAFDRRAIPVEAEESFWRAPDGQALRRIDWPASGAAGRGSLLYLPGRADFYEKYLESLAQWHRAGWHVTSTDWRGQAFSGRLGDDQWTGHVDDFAVWVNDLADFWAEWIAQTAPPHVIVGHSMGGHLVLRALAEHRIAPAAAVLVAPMLGLVPAFVPIGLTHAFARLMTKLSSPVHRAWRGSEKPGRMPDDREDLLTHDAVRYDDERWWRRERPELAMAAPSWGWIERSIASMRLLRAPGLLEGVSTPVLILATTEDQLVDFGAIANAAKSLPNCELHAFGGEARHEILRECDAVRDVAMSRIDGFLETAAPPAR